jgi:D-inositol-3-phosphate glycosyltransferase
LKAIIIGPAFPLRGGIANFNEALCREFNHRSWDTKIISFSLQYPSFLFPGSTQFDTVSKPPDGLVIESLLNSINPVTWFKTAKKIREFKPDFVVIRYWLPFMGPCLGTLARLIKKGGNIKVIALADNVVPHEKRPGDKLFTRYFLSGCDAYMVMTQSVLNDIRLFDTAKPIICSPHPVYDMFGSSVEKSEAREKLELDQNGRYILFFGFIRKYKGLDLLLKAMGDDKLKNLNITLIIAGEYYESPEYYKDLIIKEGIQDKVMEHTHFISNEMVKYYFCASDLVVQPYRSATQSGVTQIAYHFGKPMLVTRVGGLPEMVVHNKAGYVSETDHLEIADFIADFYQNNRETEFSRFVDSQKHIYSWKTFVDKLTTMASDLK